MIKNISGIYCIKNKINKKKYIGSSKNISYRYGRHFSNLRRNKHKNKHLQNAVNKYGIENFSFEIIEIVKNNNLIIREQFYINNTKWEMLYNTTKIAGSGGGDIRRKKLYMLDLEGNILKKFSSGVELAKFLNLKLLNYKNINTKSINKKKYRVVTPEFYNKNIKEIKSWKPYSCKSRYRTKEFKKDKFIIYNNNEKYTFNTFYGIAKKLNISFQRVSQIYKFINSSNKKNFFHKKSGFFVAYIKKKV